MTAVEAIRGDTFDASVVEWIWKLSGTPQDITGYTARLKVTTKSKVSILDVNTSGAAGNKLLIPTGTDGRIVPDIEAANMTDLIPGEYWYDIEVTSPTGVVTTVVRKGTFTILEDVAE